MFTLNLMRIDKWIRADNFFDITLDMQYKEFLNHHITCILLFYLHMENGGTLGMVLLIINSIDNLGGYFNNLFIGCIIYISPFSGLLGDADDICKCCSHDLTAEVIPRKPWQWPD